MNDLPVISPLCPHAVPGKISFPRRSRESCLTTVRAGFVSFPKPRCSSRCDRGFVFSAPRRAQLIAVNGDTYLRGVGVTHFCKHPYPRPNQAAEWVSPISVIPLHSRTVRQVRWPDDLRDGCRFVQGPPAFHEPIDYLIFSGR